MRPLVWATQQDVESMKTMDLIPGTRRASARVRRKMGTVTEGIPVNYPTVILRGVYNVYDMKYLKERLMHGETHRSEWL